MESSAVGEAMLANASRNSLKDLFRIPGFHLFKVGGNLSLGRYMRNIVGIFLGLRLAPPQLVVHTIQEPWQRSQRLRLLEVISLSLRAAGVGISHEKRRKTVAVPPGLAQGRCLPVSILGCDFLIYKKYRSGFDIHFRAYSFWSLWGFHNV